MVKSSKGIRARTRTIFRKHPRERGFPPVTRFFQKFEPGEKVHIVIDSSVHRGQPHARHHGTTGTIIGMQGRAYVVGVRNGGKLKRIIATPVHLRKYKAGCKNG